MVASVDIAIAVIAVLAALVAFAAIGLRGTRADGDVDDYVVARDSQPTGLLGLSFFASGMGAWILFAPPELGASVGLAAVAGYALAAAAPILLFGVLGPRLRTVVPAGHSLTEFLRLRFGSAFNRWVVAVSVAYMLLFVTAELTAAGAVTALLAGLDARLTIVAIAVATLVYTALGGLRASLRTDRWQAWLVLVLLAVAVIAVVVALPEPGAAWQRSGLLGVDGTGVEVFFTLIIAVTAANLFHQGYWQRVWAARDGTALGGGALLGAGLTMPVVALVGVLGVLAAGAGLELGSPPAPLFALLAGLPGWVGVAVIVLAVALVASSVDTLESGLASLVTAERPGTSLGAARWTTVVLMVPAVALAVQGYSVLQLLLIADLLCASTAAPALLGLWRRATTAGALAGAVAGLVAAVAAGRVAEGSWTAWTFPAAVPTLGPFLGALVASAVVAVAVSLAGRSSTDLEALGERVPALDGRL